MLNYSKGDNKVVCNCKTQRPSTNRRVMVVDDVVQNEAVEANKNPELLHHKNVFSEKEHLITTLCGHNCRLLRKS